MASEIGSVSVGGGGNGPSFTLETGTVSARSDSSSEDDTRITNIYTASSLSIVKIYDFALNSSSGSSGKISVYRNNEKMLDYTTNTNSYGNINHSKMLSSYYANEYFTIMLNPSDELNATVTIQNGSRPCIVDVKYAAYSIV